MLRTSVPASVQVAQAVSNQLFTLNTNSRYLHGALAEYTQELLATFPKHLQVGCFPSPILAEQYAAPCASAEVRQ